jgi:UDP-glucuronate 4-epimerase
MRQSRILLTGCAGFIGYSLALKLLNKKYFIDGIDNLNSYYDKKLKLARLKILKKKKIFFFLK